jgi:hypothetical protein
MSAVGSHATSENLILPLSRATSLLPTPTSGDILLRLGHDSASKRGVMRDFVASKTPSRNATC